MSPTFHVFRARVSGAHADPALVEAWAALRSYCPWLPEMPTKGLFTAENGSQAIQIVRSDRGVLACEYLDIETRDAWEGFFIFTGQEEIACGWARRGDLEYEAPDAFVAGAVELGLVGPVIKVRSGRLFDSPSPLQVEANVRAVVAAAERQVEDVYASAAEDAFKSLRGLRLPVAPVI